MRIITLSSYFTSFILLCFFFLEEHEKEKQMYLKNLGEYRDSLNHGSHAPLSKILVAVTSINQLIRKNLRLDILHISLAQAEKKNFFIVVSSTPIVS